MSRSNGDGMPENVEITVAVHEERLAKIEAEQTRIREKLHDHGNKLAILSEVKENFDRLDRHVRDMGREFSIALTEIRAALSDIKTKLATYDGQEQGDLSRRSTIVSLIGLLVSMITAALLIYVFLEQHLIRP